MKEIRLTGCRDQMDVGVRLLLEVGERSCLEHL